MSCGNSIRFIGKSWFMFCIFLRQKRVFASRLRCEENIFCLYVCTLFFILINSFWSAFLQRRVLANHFLQTSLNIRKLSPWSGHFYLTKLKSFVRGTAIDKQLSYSLSPRIHFSGNVLSHVIVCFLLCMHTFMRILLR